MKTNYIYTLVKSVLIILSLLFIIHTTDTTVSHGVHPIMYIKVDETRALNFLRVCFEYYDVCIRNKNYILISNSDQREFCGLIQLFPLFLQNLNILYESLAIGFENLFDTLIKVHRFYHRTICIVK